MNHGDSFKATIWGLSAVTMITKEAKEPNNRVLLGALLFIIVLFLLLYVIFALVPTEGTTKFSEVTQ